MSLSDFCAFAGYLQVEKVSRSLDCVHYRVLESLKCVLNALRQLGKICLAIYKV